MQRNTCTTYTAPPCTGLTEAEEGAWARARSLHHPHNGSAPALHPRFTQLHQVDTWFTICSHLHALHTGLTPRLTPQPCGRAGLSRAVHTAEASALHPLSTRLSARRTPLLHPPHNTLRLLWTGLQQFVPGLSTPHCSYSTIADHILTSTRPVLRVRPTSIRPIRVLTHFPAPQAVVTWAGAPARGWRGSRRCWCFSGRRWSTSGS